MEGGWAVNFFLAGVGVKRSFFRKGAEFCIVGLVNFWGLRGSVINLKGEGKESLMFLGGDNFFLFWVWVIKVFCQI